LKTAGAIHFQFSGRGSHTQSKQAELFNGSPKFQHFSVFELVKLGNSDWTSHSELMTVRF